MPMTFISRVVTRVHAMFRSSNRSFAAFASASEIVGFVLLTATVEAGAGLPGTSCAPQPVSARAPTSGRIVRTTIDGLYIRSLFVE
ncbi:MAG: hypothetical protein ABS81_04310 [Pseudonocardia sp. SCN 72-86]|nr:MAG: hypothetical protein ABS81_04310 [Pseudonocardia sp. SCN 72-86]